MVSSITQDPYSIIISLNLASSVNLNIGAPPRPTELTTAAPGAEYADCADCGPRFPPLRPTGLPTPIATTAAPARVPPGPGRQHVGPDHRLMWR